MTPHACNEPLRCPCCQKRFWQWAHSFTRGSPRRRPRRDGTMPVQTALTFYEAAGLFIDRDRRAERAA